MKLALASLFAALAAAQTETESAVDPASLTTNCSMCIFEGFKFCQPNLSSGTSTCLTSNQVCPSSTSEQTSFSQCNSRYFTTSASSNCGTSYKIA